MSNILVTGGAGFIGSHVATTLLRQGHRVSLIDVLDPYYPLALKHYNLEHLKQHGFRPIDFFDVDIRNRAVIHQIVADLHPEVIIHLAAKAGVRHSLENPEEYFSTNVDGTLNVLQAAHAARVHKVMIASSSSVYGENAKVPFHEDDSVESQVSPYAASKRAMEVLCKMYAHTYHLPLQLFRFFTVYGPSGRPDMAPALFTKAILLDRPLTIFGSTTTERDYTFVDDVVHGLFRALPIDDNFAIYNLGNDRPEPLSHLIAAIEHATEKKARIQIVEKRTGDVGRTWADIEKARTRLGYHPQVTLEDGIQRFVDWFRAHKELYE